MSKLSVLRGDVAKKKYRYLCETENDIPIFSQYWYLDSLCDDADWEVILLQNEEKIVASLPIYREKKFFFTFIKQPKLVQNLGIWIKYPDNQNYQNKKSLENKVIEMFVNEIPRNDMISINMNYNYQNLIAFHWHGFVETSRYTYILNLEEDIKNIYNSFSPNMRNKIRKSEKLVNIKETDDIKIVYDLILKTFKRQNKKLDFSLDYLKKHDFFLKNNKSRKIFIALDKITNEPHSVLYLIWDKISSYVHFVGEDPEKRSSGAGINLIYESIRYSKEELKLKILDFEGSMIESIEKVRRNCGGKQMKYSSIRKINSLTLKILYSLVRNN
tara:strand:+ start:5261 stop:6247 length:987 start_codon:yes stop_codon:yes gene_type:complete